MNKPETLNKILNDKYVIAFLILFVSLYSDISKIVLPDWFLNLFKNDIFRLLFICLILLIPIKQSPHIAIIVSVLFIITLNLVFEKDTREKMIITEKFISV